MLIELSRPTATAEMVAELAEALRLPSGFGADPERDARLARHLDVATGLVEAQARRALRTRPALLRVAAWEDGPALRLPLGPALSVEAVTLEDAAGARAPLDPALWRLDALRGALAPRPGAGWPTVPAGGFVEVAFTAGYGPAWADAPASLRLATLTLAAALHDGRDPGAPPPPTVNALLAPYRPVRL